jgi:hypothetical protein
MPLRFLVLGILALAPGPLRAVETTPAGELKVWHKLTLDFEGPESSETATPNPFTDYRLDVTFSHPASGTHYLVPGYYAADGQAANTSASSGKIWRVHFAPDQVGVWNYSVSFRSGPAVAMAADPAAGTSGGHFDGRTGSFAIDASDKTGRDFRGKGRLEYVGKHHLRHAGTGSFFMKAGTDSPENLLAYADFDGDFKSDGVEDGRIKTWAPHLADWREGDPVWQGDKGKGLIGAVNYLASEGLNAISFLTLNINGDDRNVFPYLDDAERLRMDVSRLDQWEIVFEHATRQGLYLHFKTQETENENLLDGGNVGPQRTLYYRELIARFSHHLALNWNLGEESRATLARRMAWAQFFHDHDPYRHHIVIHNGSSHFDLMEAGSKVTGMSKQMNAEDFRDTFFDIRRWLDKSKEEGKPWVVACDEPGNSRDSLRPDSDPGNSHLDARRDALWATILAGGAGIEFYFGYDYPHSDLTCEDFRSRDSFWDYCRHALWLFENHPFPFELMADHSALVSGTGSEQTSNSGSGGNRCLARIGDTYLVHLRSGGTHTLDLSAASGVFTVHWFNPRAGGPLIPAADLNGGAVVSLGSPPDTPTEDWIVLVESVDGGSGTNTPPAVDAGPDKSAFLNGPDVAVALDGAVSDDGLPDEFALTRAWSLVAGPAPVSFSNPNASTTHATFTAAGTYRLRLVATDSDLTSSDEVEVAILEPETGAPRFFTPVHDAFTDEGLNDNGTLLRVAAGLRRTYLQFDLSTAQPGPATRVLRLTEGEGIAPGPLTLRLFAADSNDWTEATIDAATAPAAGTPLATFTGEPAAGQSIEFDLGSHAASAGIYSFVLEAEPGSLAFASKEHPAPEIRPVLIVTPLVNSPPVFAGYAIATSINRPVTIPYSQILAAAADPDGDPLALALAGGVTPAGGEVVMGPDGLTYTPVIDLGGPDTFPLTVEDGRGGTAVADLTIEVVLSDGIEGRVPGLARLPDGSVSLSFEGHPGFQYDIQRSTDLKAWERLTTINGGATGRLDYLDPAAPAPAAFYRVVAP